MTTFCQSLIAAKQERVKLIDNQSVSANEYQDGFSVLINITTNPNHLHRYVNKVPCHFILFSVGKLIFSKATSLGLWWKKKWQRRGRYNFVFAFLFPWNTIPYLMPTLYLFTQILYSQRIIFRFVKVVCKLIILPVELWMHQRFADLNVARYFQIIPYHLESMDFGTEIDGTEDFFQMFWPIIVSHKIGKILGRLSTGELYTWQTFKARRLTFN